MGGGGKSPTSNDCMYQFATLRMDGISLRLSGSWFSSFTRCASRIGNSSLRNWEARNKVPVRCPVNGQPVGMIV